jgi:hypothetical protein
LLTVQKPALAAVQASREIEMALRERIIGGTPKGGNRN